MNGHIKQKNGLTMHFSLNEYRVFLDFSNDANSIDLSFPREEEILRTIVIALDMPSLVTKVDIQGFMYCISLTENVVNYDDIRYNLNINNLLFELDRQTYVQLHYFINNVRPLREDEKTKQEPW